MNTSILNIKQVNTTCLKLRFSQIGEIETPGKASWKHKFSFMKPENEAYLPDKWNIACHISKQRMSQSSVITATAYGELLNPEGTQEGKEYLLSSSHQTIATPHREP